ncbi:MAG: sugar ABC transporter substrate-binding protein [Alphaproteobacteria bacterium]|nr:sugar ABC transporter substrate-binding protein [Alphaproteobacteria bacterium]
MKNISKKLMAMGVACTMLSGGIVSSAMAEELRMTIWSANEGHLALFNGIADGFVASHPDVTVKFDSLPFSNYTTTVTTQIAGGNAPDLAWILETTAADFVNSGALYPLNDVLNAADDYDLDDVSKPPLGLWSRDGVILAMPFSTSPFAMFVNNDLIKDAGAKSPSELIATGDWNWENAIKTASAVGATGKAGLIVRDFKYQNWKNLASIWSGWDAAPWSADGKDCTFAEPEMVSAMNFIHDAIFEKNAIPGPGESVDFFAGDAALTITQISRASLLPKENAFDWDLVPLPAGPAGEYSLIGQAAIGVFASSKNAELAAEFLAYMTNPENSAKLAQFFPSIRGSLLNAKTLGETNALLSEDQLNKVVIEGIAKGSVIPGHTGFAQIEQIVRAGLDAVWVPNADIETALANVCSRIKPLLAR